jgi:hypothetical protein
MPMPRRLLSLAATALVLASATAACSGSSSGDQANGDASTDASKGHGDAGGRDAKVVDAAPPDDVFVPNRAPGQRTPLSADCEQVDGTRCLLPWPSNTYTVVDPTSATGLRVALSPKGIATTDDATSVNRSDGFSRVTPIQTAFDGTLDPKTFGDLTTGGVRLIVEQPGSSFGQLVPVRFDVIVDVTSGKPESLLLIYPRVPLDPATDYAVVVTDSIHFTDGTKLEADRNAQVALGLDAPRTSAEGALYAYDAPGRAALKAAGLDAKSAVRIWDFTTRSLAQPTTDLQTMRAAEIAAFDAAPVPVRPSIVDGGTPPDASPDAGNSDATTGSTDAATSGLTFAIDSVSTTVNGSLLMAVTGRITGVPSYLTASGSLSRAADGTPLASGVHDVPFRAAIPVGTGDYRVVMYGHGTGGTYDETSFDDEITQNGATKIGTQFIGWTSSSILGTFNLFASILVGTEISSAGLTQSLADTMLVQHALGGSLGTLLGAPSIGGVVNPAAGRKPSLDQPVWAGGSLGGTMGFVYSAVEPSITAAVLNVPGAAWTHFVTYSYLFNVVRLIMQTNYHSPIDISLGVATSQINFDGIDGANWVDAVGDHHPLLLEQESMGDPVLPNIGNEMVASSSHAQQVGVVLNPIVTCEDVAEATAHTGMTQFKVPSTVTAPLDIHGFAAGSSPAGVAAQQQIKAFIASVWANAPLISVPPECMTNTPPDSCDFTND